MKRAILLLALLAGCHHPAPVATTGRPPWLPDPALTPGAIVLVGPETVCKPGYAGQSRGVTEAMKRAVFHAYGIPPDSTRYEIDHLIPLCLAGSNDVRNLFPQPWDGPCGARVKDRLEVQVYRDVCAGKLTLQEGQAIFRGDWTRALGRLKP
jgi:hypothetical protein